MGLLYTAGFSKSPAQCLWPLITPSSRAMNPQTEVTPRLLLTHTSLAYFLPNVTSMCSRKCSGNGCPNAVS